MGFLQDDQGNNSSIRLMSVMALVASIAFGMLTIVRPGSEIGLYLTLLFLLAAFAPKVLQKAIEQRLALPPTSVSIGVGNVVSQSTGSDVVIAEKGSPHA